MQPGIFLNNWSSLEDMRRDFAVSDEELRGVRVLLASYGTPDYEGYAFVLFKKGRKLFEVNASHCSCYGLENQWSPEETSVAALRHRITHGELGSRDYEENPFAEQLLQVLDALTPGRKSRGTSDSETGGKKARTRASR